MSQVHKYATTSDTWVTVNDLPKTDRYYAKADTISDKVYYVGGGNIGNPDQTTFAYDLSTDTWVSKNAMPTFRMNSGPGAGVALRTLFAAAGGNAPNPPVCPDGKCNTLEGYNVDTDAWLSFNSVPTTRGGDGLSASVIHSKFLYRP